MRLFGRAGAISTSSWPPSSSSSSLYEMRPGTSISSTSFGRIGKGMPAAISSSAIGSIEASSRGGCSFWSSSSAAGSGTVAGTAASALVLGDLKWTPRNESREKRRDSACSIPMEMTGDLIFFFQALHSLPSVRSRATRSMSSSSMRILSATSAGLREPSLSSFSYLACIRW